MNKAVNSFFHLSASNSTGSCIFQPKVLLLIFFFLSFYHQSSYALCAAQAEDGNWVNTDPNTRSLTKAELTFTCQDQVLNGELYPPGPPWHIRLQGSCSPTDCDWGKIGAQTVTVGDRTYIFTTYDQGFAKRYVYADMSLYREGQLWIWMWTDFTDPNRPDYESQNWFQRQ